MNQDSNMDVSDEENSEDNRAETAVDFDDDELIDVETIGDFPLPIPKPLPTLSETSPIPSKAPSTSTAIEPDTSPNDEPPSVVFAPGLDESESKKEYVIPVKEAIDLDKLIEYFRNNQEKLIPKEWRADKHASEDVEKKNSRKNTHPTALKSTTSPSASSTASVKKHVRIKKTEAKQTNSNSVCIEEKNEKDESRSKKKKKEIPKLAEGSRAKEEGLQKEKKKGKGTKTEDGKGQEHKLKGIMKSSAKKPEGKEIPSNSGKTKERSKKVTFDINSRDKDNAPSTGSECREGEHKCGGQDLCLPQEALCNGINDCRDGSDEEECEKCKGGAEM